MYILIVPTMFIWFPYENPTFLIAILFIFMCTYTALLPETHSPVYSSTHILFYRFRIKTRSRLHSQFKILNSKF
jgi:hypothetical protein